MDVIRVALIIDGGHFLSIYTRTWTRNEVFDPANGYRIMKQALVSLITNAEPTNIPIVFEQTDFFHATENGQPEDLHRELQDMFVRVELKTYKVQSGTPMVITYLTSQLHNLTSLTTF